MSFKMSKYARSDRLGQSAWGRSWRFPIVASGVTYRCTRHGANAGLSHATARRTSPRLRRRRLGRLPGMMPIVCVTARDCPDTPRLGNRAAGAAALPPFAERGAIRVTACVRRRHRRSSRRRQWSVRRMSHRPIRVCRLILRCRRTGRPSGRCNCAHRRSR